MVYMLVVAMTEIDGQFARSRVEFFDRPDLVVIGAYIASIRVSTLVEIEVEVVIKITMKW